MFATLFLLGIGLALWMAAGVLTALLFVLLAWIVPAGGPWKLVQRISLGILSRSSNWRVHVLVAVLWYSVFLRILWTLA